MVLFSPSQTWILAHEKPPQNCTGPSYWRTVCSFPDTPDPEGEARGGCFLLWGTGLGLRDLCLVESCEVGLVPCEASLFSEIGIFFFSLFDIWATLGSAQG